jgi:antitoxin FitA
MARIVVRNIEDNVITRLKQSAKRNGRSLEEEARGILRNAAYEPESETGGLGSEIAALFNSIGLDEEIKELRGHAVMAARSDGDDDGKP